MLNKAFWYLYIAIILVSIGGILFSYGSEMVADEPIHNTQIEWFAHGDYRIVPKITMIPGYHMIISILTSGAYSFDNARIATTIFLTLTLIPAFYILTRSWRKTLLFYMCPLMFVFYFLVYTDLTSVLFVILAMAALYRKRYNWSGIFFIASILIRQTNFVWLIFGIIYILYETAENYPCTTRFGKGYWIEVLRSTWTYAIGIILFGLFIAWNGGIVIGDRESHPIGLYTSNIYYMLFMIFIIFLPSIMLRMGDIIKWVRTHKSVSIIIIIIGILLSIFNLSNPHWYNNILVDGSVLNTGIIHNIMMTWAVSNIGSRIAFMSIVLIALFYIIITKLEKPIHYLIYPFSIFTVISSEMVDSRYYMIPIALFIAFRKEGIEKEEWYILGYFILLGIAMYIGAVRHVLMW